MFGIEGIELYFPKTYVDQADYCKCIGNVETFKKAGTGKYTKGLGQLQLSFAHAFEDVNSMCLTGIKSKTQWSTTSCRTIISTLPRWADSK